MKSEMKKRRAPPPPSPGLLGQDKASEKVGDAPLSWPKHFFTDPVTPLQILENAEFFTRVALANCVQGEQLSFI